ncbi:MAG: hypothetical protein ACXVGH_09425 [Mycobacteriales bacterium]
MTRTRAGVAVALVLTAGCGVTTARTAPRCGDWQRLALVAQSVPTAAYVPCLRPLPTGWRVSSSTVERGRTELALLSDRSGGRPVVVTLTARCDARRSAPAPARAEGVRSSVRLTSVAPRYAGELLDRFAGGCLRSSFAFPRGPHIPLMEQLSAAVALVPRREVRAALRRELGVELDP